MRLRRIVRDVIHLMMMWRKTLLLPSLLLVLGACNINSGDGLIGGDRTWVAKQFTGGRQCSPEEEYEAPDVEALLEGEGIEVFDTEVEHHPVCAACNCPDYSATHYALIDDDQPSVAQKLGFERKIPPDDA